MLLVSNHLLNKTHIPFPDDTVIRVNAAWMKDLEYLKETLAGISHAVYLDYPQGRSKPPKPTLALEDVIALAHVFPNVKYFAVSNVEDPEAIFAIQQQLPEGVELIPKIETRKGIEQLEEIIEKIQARHIMLDKEDLYVDVNRDGEVYNELIELARAKTTGKGAHVLELHGVVFGI